MQLMHLLKVLASGSLVLGSLLWFTIQQVFLPNEFVKRLFVHTESGNVDFLQLKRDWCRVRSKTITWREMLEPCRERALFMADPRYATNPTLSHVSQIVTRPAGEHTRIRIDTYTGHGVLKSFGGDSFRVTFRGPDVVAAVVFDLRNGSYEALSLLLTPGQYSVEVILDYTQCNGFKDPPTDWYVKAHCAGRHNKTIIPRATSSSTFDYINKVVSAGLTIEIDPPRYNLRELRMITSYNDCGFSCKKIWDGHGVWSKDKLWTQYINPGYDISPFKERQEVKMKQRSTLWIYGDSISYYFHERIKNKRLCRRVFNTCGNTYNWIYPKALYELRQFCEDTDIDTPKLRHSFSNVIRRKDMDKNSVLIFNLGSHFVKDTSFRKYRDIIDELLEELKYYPGRPIWKTTTAIHTQNIEVMGAFRRYLTSQRVQLFNAYANAAICNADIDLLDVYPLTSSYPDGTKDGVHYHRNASQPMENMLIDYFSFGNN